MNGLKPIIISNGVFEIHPFRKSDIIRHDAIANDLFEIFGDIDSIPYNKEKFVKDVDTVTNQMLGITYGYQQQIRYTHFITQLESNKTIGEIMILTPKSVEPSYKLKDTWIIEYYLNKRFWNKGIMSGAIGAIISNMKSQGITNIGALVDKNNQSSIRVLEKSGLKKVKQFDIKQDFYKI